MSTPIILEALCGTGVDELRAMLEEREAMVYRALRERPDLTRRKYMELVALCDAKRAYEVPPEYSGILNIEGRKKWSPTDTEVARVLVAATVAEVGTKVLYSDLVSRLNSILTSMARPHIYRSLKVIMRESAARDFVQGIRLR